MSLIPALSLARASATSRPSTIGGAVRFSEAILMVLSIRLRARASRSEAVRPPNTTARIWRESRRIERTMLKPESWM